MLLSNTQNMRDTKYALSRLTYVHPYPRYQPLTYKWAGVPGPAVTRRSSALSEMRRSDWFNFQSARLAFTTACLQNNCYPNFLFSHKRSNGGSRGGFNFQSTPKALHCIYLRGVPATRRALFILRSRGLENNWIPKQLLPQFTLLS
jgi:hypothetical protein